MGQVRNGYWEAAVHNCPPGSTYSFSVDGGPNRPDPASLWQPGNDVHADSAVVSTGFDWTDDKWSGLPLEEYVIYELHVGTFTPEGTFEAAIKELPRLKKLGITAIEVMPIAQFPGERNWGYDGVYPYAAADCYGGLKGFQELVNAAHLEGLAVVLDVVYNHLGPEGNYFSYFGPYFNENYHTPWGAGLNFDSDYSDGVRDFFIGNALFWINTCHVDALRLDAVHSIIDNSAYTFLQQLCEQVHALGRSLHKRVYVIGENDRNDPRFVKFPAEGGIGADSQWCDDFHHALHAVATGETQGYYEDFGKVSQLAKAFTDGFVYDGIYSPHRKQRHGGDGRDLEGIRFVVFSQNHDQVGNRPNGSRLSELIDFSLLKVCAATLMSAPYVPLIFMGEERGVRTPFLYFVDHGDETLIKNIREGRAREFKHFVTMGEPVDPQSHEAFDSSKLKRNTSPEEAAIERLYKELLRLRRDIPAMRTLNKRRTSAIADDLNRTLVVRREENDSVVLCLFNFCDEQRTLYTSAEAGTWDCILDTNHADYLGTRNDTPSSVSSEGALKIPMLPKTAILLHYRHQ